MRCSSQQLLQEAHLLGSGGAASCEAREQGFNMDNKAIPWQESLPLCKSCCFLAWRDWKKESEYKENYHKLCQDFPAALRQMIRSERCRPVN